MTTDIHATPEQAIASMDNAILRFYLVAGTVQGTVREEPEAEPEIHTDTLHAVFSIPDDIPFDSRGLEAAGRALTTRFREEARGLDIHVEEILRVTLLNIAPLGANTASEFFK